MIRRGYIFGGQSTFWYSTEYDLLGRPTNATDSVSLEREWLYNRRSELAAASIGTNLYGYAYDTIGNRLWSAENAATNSYTANSLNQYTSVAASTNLVYDADGNLTNDGIFSYSYDAENRLVAAYPLSPVVGSLAVLNRYDHKHRRVQKIVKQYNGTTWETAETHTFVWDGNNIVLEKVAFADGTTRMCEYFWGMDKSGTEQGAGGVEGLLAVSIDGVFYIPCYDHNGNIILCVSELGSIAAQYTYDPYGNMIEQSGNLATEFSFGFSTQYHDREVGMVGYKRRFYRPGLGRWLNRNPIEEDGGENLYAFCHNNCVSLYDIIGFNCTIGTYNVSRLDIWEKPAANGLSSNPNFFNHGDSLMSSLGILGTMTSLSSLSGKALSDFQTFVDYAVGKGITPSADAIARLRRLYDLLKAGPKNIKGILEYELCVCSGGKGKFEKQPPITKEEYVLDGSDQDEISRARSIVMKQMMKELNRRMKR